MVTLQCCECGHVWQHLGDVGGGTPDLPCPKCGSDAIVRIGKRRGKRRRRSLPCEEYQRARMLSQQVWQRTAARGQAHKGKGRG